MRYYKIYTWFLITCFIACGYSLSASHFEFNHQAEQADSTEPQYILYFDILQPIAFGKAGLTFSVKKTGLEYQVYANYIFRRDGITEYPIYSVSERQWGSYTKEPYAGAELGIQIRFPFRSDWEDRTYAKYIVDDGGRSGFVFGSWAELAYKKTASEYRSFQSVELWDSKMGGLLGWSESNDKFAIDLFGGVGVGRVSASLKDSNFQLDSKEHSFLIVYKLGVKVGIKL